MPASPVARRARAVALAWLATVFGCATLAPADDPTHSRPAPEATTAGDETLASTTGGAAPRDAGVGGTAPVDDRPALETTRGRVSYYADSLAGRSTASGEPYDPRLLTAASRTLPFGTLVRVVREDTGASVIVRVNDRGPFGSRARILDLSRAAAEAIGMIRAGVVSVRAEVIEWGPRRR